jgi:uncharacterized protein YyaL (SSP411 family)
MAHESFEDPDTAAFMNAHFVNVKVDREERPDIDAVYMQATQAMAGQGGWPMTCVLTPAGEPFFAGTYFPPEPRGGLPAFGQVLQALADAWANRRDEVLEVGGNVVRQLGERTDTGGAPLTADDLGAAARSLATEFDHHAAGFGSAPKFPPSMILEFLLRHHDRTQDAGALELAARTGEAMARGGIYDQLGGGFARYSVDRYWRVPHFEKMLYDNALLLRFYLHWNRQQPNPMAERVARETADFLLAELRTGEGGFASSLDADSDGHEGTFYVWNRAQLVLLLGADDGAWAADLLRVTESGTFERGLSTLQLLRDPDDPQRWAAIRERLLRERARRTRPARDDKVVAAWNALAITALCEAGVLLDEPRYATAAVEAAELLLRVHVTDGRMLRTSRDGVASGAPGVLEDHGCVAEAFLAVLGLTGDAAWLDHALALLETVLSDFADPDGGFFDTADDDLVLRPRDVSDTAYPCGTSAVVHAFVAAAAITGDPRWRLAAESGVTASAEVARRAPRFAGWTLAAAEAMLAGPLEIAVVGEDVAVMHRAALSLTSPGAVVVAGRPGLEVGLFEGRGLVAGDTAAYVCRNFVCDLPVSDPAALAASVRLRTGSTPAH